MVQAKSNIDWREGVIDRDAKIKRNFHTFNGARSRAGKPMDVVIADSAEEIYFKQRLKQMISRKPFQVKRSVQEFQIYGIFSMIALHVIVDSIMAFKRKLIEISF